MLPVIAIQHPTDPSVRMLINATEFREGEHVVWGEQVDPVHDDLRVQRGARGLWFVKRGGETVSPGFKTEADAVAAQAEMVG